MSTDDSSALLHAARSARANAEPSDLVKYTNALADALGVREWQEYMKSHGLAASQTVDRTTVITEICTAILNKLPPRLSRHRLQHLLARVETALHISLPGSRFRSAGCDADTRCGGA